MSLERLKEIARDENIPIVSDEGLKLIHQIIIKHQVQTVLEIGTAIGYSALAMASFGCHVDTFERNEQMIEQASKHFDRFDAEKRIRLIPFDALTYTGELKMYDMIFIDAAKAQYERFFEKFQHYLKPNGVIVCDNLRFHDLDPQNVNRHTKQLLRKISGFKSFLKNHPDYVTIFDERGDGMSITMRHHT
jgi:predicted O-methyltransferase YrrM